MIVSIVKYCLYLEFREIIFVFQRRISKQFSKMVTTRKLQKVSCTCQAVLSTADKPFRASSSPVDARKNGACGVAICLFRVRLRMDFLFCCLGRWFVWRGGGDAFLNGLLNSHLPAIVCG